MPLLNGRNLLDDFELKVDFLLLMGGFHGIVLTDCIKVEALNFFSGYLKSEARLGRDSKVCAG